MLLGSITDVKAEHCGLCVVVGSHGARSTGRWAAAHRLASLICNDAGFGLDQAGVAALGELDVSAIPAACVGHLSARIGDAADMLDRGTVTAVNTTAAALGVSQGMSALEAQDRFLAQRPSTASLGSRPPKSNGHELPGAVFAKHIRHHTDRDGKPIDIIIVDSASSIDAGAEGAIVVTGSHGGLPGNSEVRAMKSRPLLAVFNDAGGGVDDAGAARLAVLDRQNVAAVCVDAFSARIGEGRSTFNTGIVSRQNEAAAALGGRLQMPVRQLIATVCDGEPISETETLS